MAANGPCGLKPAQSRASTVARERRKNRAAHICLPAGSCRILHEGPAPDLDPELSARLFPYVGGVIKELKGAPIIINRLADHVYALLSISPATSVADLLWVLKTNSSRWVHEQFPERERFAGQSRYGAFTVSSFRTEAVRAYIASRCEHHRRVSFQEEFLSLLKRHRLECPAVDYWG
jgi:putative transposase